MLSGADSATELPSCSSPIQVYATATQATAQTEQVQLQSLAAHAARIVSQEVCISRILWSPLIETF